MPGLWMSLIRVKPHPANWLRAFIVHGCWISVGGSPTSTASIPQTFSLAFHVPSGINFKHLASLHSWDQACMAVVPHLWPSTPTVPGRPCPAEGVGYPSPSHTRLCHFLLETHLIFVSRSCSSFEKERLWECWKVLFPIQFWGSAYVQLILPLP